MTVFRVREGRSLTDTKRPLEEDNKRLKELVAVLNRALRDPNDPPWKLGSDIPRFETLLEQFAALAVELRHHLDALERAAADPLAAGAGAILGRALHGSPLSDERHDAVVGVLLALEDAVAAIRAARHRRPKK